MKVFRYRLKPTKAQISKLNEQLELCRWTYNETLAMRKNSYEHEAKSLSYFETKRMLPIWKESKPELRSVHSQVLQDVVLRVNLAFQAFFRRAQSDEVDPGYPRFKGKNRYDSISYPQSGFSIDGLMERVREAIEAYLKSEKDIEISEFVGVQVVEAEAG